MPMRVLKEIRTAVKNLNPDEVRATAERPLDIGLVASTDASYAAMEEYLLPPDKISHLRSIGSLRLLHRAGNSELPDRFDLVLYEQGLPCPQNAFTFYMENPMSTVREILAERSELSLPLARAFHPFRAPVIDNIIHSVSRDSALFAVVTALPDVIPSIIELPWSIGEFASDTAFITINQIRMAFLIAAASDKEVGYSAQKAEIASIITSAFGWRAVARELVGKIPFGGGLIPKGAIAFAGTHVVGLGLERFHRVGYGLTRAERRESYQAAFERGKGIVELVLRGIRGRSAA